MTDFRLLGPLEVFVDGRRIELPPGKPSALLARLLLDAGRVVSVDSLVDALWAEPVPPSAYKVVQVYVSQLRKALGVRAIETRAPGYVVRAAREEVDLGRFEALTEAARTAGEAARRRELLRRALDLWRGPALAEFAAAPFARAAAQRLAELRLSALEQRLEADLELGEHARVIAELEALVDHEPLREQPRRQLMLALYRSGRQADALARFREGRRALVEQLGIEPGPALQELERAILRHDPALERPHAEPRRARGCVVSVGSSLRELLAPLCSDGRELLLVELPSDAAELGERAAALERSRVALVERGVAARTACFTSQSLADDLVRLASEQAAELLAIVGLPPLSTRGPLLSATPCDVAFAARPDLRFAPGDPVLVPFGGGREEWAALELGAWLARAHGLRLRLLGAEAAAERRDASRLLASASLALQRFAGTAAETGLIAPGADGVLAEEGSVVVASLPPGELAGTRAALVERTQVPLLLVHAGLRPGGLAPDRTLTQFSWSLRDADRTRPT
jgi:DNA-binding SARP family transcriptional activator